MEQIAQPFEFKISIGLLKFTGIRAKDLRELRAGIAQASEECLFHHTYQYFLKGPILEYTNDFAHWAGESLEETALAEHLSIIDPYSFVTINDVRHEILGVIDAYLKAFPQPREVFPGDEFYFNETVSIIVPLDLRVRNLAEFLLAIKHVNPGTIYYHFYEARQRLGGQGDDISCWVETSLGKRDLAERIRAIDAFMHSAEEIRKHITDLMEAEAKKDMEVR
jgi:Family of unknown function (DUF5752)